MDILDSCESLDHLRKPIVCKWVYKVKYNVDGTLDKHKARLVVKGFAQQEGIDYGDKFAPTAKMVAVRLVLALATHFGWTIVQIDVMSAFLNGHLEEEVYMYQPQGFQFLGKEHMVCILFKAIYGLK